MKLTFPLLMATLVCALGLTARAQTPLPYLRGQDVVPVYEGWERNADGSFTMIFGYMNRNYEETPNIQPGASNSVEPGGPDRGQPTFFYPRRQQFIYRVRVPQDWGSKDLVWTLVAQGKTEKAYGSLAPMWEIDRELMVKNLGRAGANLDAVGRDVPPSITMGGTASADVGRPVTLTAVVADDGIPKLPAARAEGDRGGESRPFSNVNVPVAPDPPRGLWTEWHLYRGPGSVTFTPDGYHTLPSGGGTASVAARFSEPGTYVLRLLASDSLLDTSKDVTVTVSGAPNVPPR